jgi:outer membrane receptor protein involved in Fe transport
MNLDCLHHRRGASLLASFLFTVTVARAQAPVGQVTAGDQTPATEEDPVKLAALDVVAGRPAALNGIDRKVYLVGKDVLAAAGSVSQMLQNLPSVEVDLDGNLSLRGSPDVLVLIDGRPSVLMGTKRAAALDQMPADTLERIEVITTPSAKYKPDGTAGIINLVTKKQKPSTGVAGSWSVNAGNSRRANSSLTLGWTPGRWAFTGTFALRQDNRQHLNTETRTANDPATGGLRRTVIHGDELWRPLTKTARTGIEFRPSAETTWSLELDANRRAMTARGEILTSDLPSGVAPVEGLRRTLRGPQDEKEVEAATRFTHAFAGEDHTMEVELRWQSENEREDSLLFTHPVSGVSPGEFEATRESEQNRARQLQIDYSRPLPGDATLELGYAWEKNANEIGSVVETFAAPVDDWAPVGPGRLFRYTETLHAGYATLREAFGPLSVQAGLRLEQARLDSELVPSRTTIANPYSRAYPTLHLKWQLAPTQELQWNYSPRVRRPYAHQLNPFPEYSDPTHVWVGNPRLKPEDIQSFEFGYQYRQGETSLQATAYYRYLTNGIGEVITQTDDSVLQSTFANLETNRSFGVELAASGAPAQWLRLDFSSNTFFDTIDASNVGLSRRKSAIASLAKLGVTFKPAAATLLQLNANFASSRLTAQGRRSANFAANVGLRREFANGRFAGVVAVTDVFRSARDRVIADLPGLRTETVHRHDSPVVYVGLIYRFGRPAKNERDDPLPFEVGG